MRDGETKKSCCRNFSSSSTTTIAISVFSSLSNLKSMNECHVSVKNVCDVPSPSSNNRLVGVQVKVSADSSAASSKLMLANPPTDPMSGPPVTC